MIEFITKSPTVLTAPTGKANAILPLSQADAALFEKLPEGKELICEIKEYRKKRSLDANAYFWVLCDQVAKAVGSTKEEIYKQKVRECGVFEMLPLKVEAVDDFIKRFAKNGLGWFAESMDASKLKGYQRVMIYFGSSTYNSQEMARLIESIVEDCQELKIPTMPPAELERLCKAYNIE